MADKSIFKQEKMKLFQFEATANAGLKENQTALAYRDLNANYFKMEKEELKGDKLSNWEKAHAERKKSIEKAWHDNTGNEVKELAKRGATKNNKKAEYYASFSLKDLEVFIKNSDRGGNSDEYNNVATDLELYNRIKEKGNPLEAYSLLLKLKKSAEIYVQERKSPNTSKGKIRKAIISQILTKTTELIESQKIEYLQKADKLFGETLEDEVADEKVNEAFRAHYDLIYHVLNGNIELGTEELEKLDCNTEALLKKVVKAKVDENQGNNISTKFFNALGWSANAPRLVENRDLNENGSEMKKSPLKKKMFHAMNPLEGMEDATSFGRQLAGTSKDKGRLFYGLGRFGKGVYTSAGKGEGEQNDRDAEANSWGYGDRMGAVMLVMTLNENARMLPYNEMIEKARLINRKFRRVNRMLEQERSSKAGYMDYLTMQAALFGYNTLIDKHPGIENVDYYVTSDRKALSISKEMRIRTDLNNFDNWDFKQL
ncbi:MAG: hypothetical protein J6O55_06460 [Lachnospiraceae bacterium]|nr:hypothetical protein [Lachnospiraceae bacterium]